MSHILSPLYEDVTTARTFGICDDKPHQRAYIDLLDGRKWIAIIENHLQIPVTFTALDNCIELRTPDNKMESRCEGALTYGDTIVFIEAKERKGKRTKDWAKAADDQLRDSIGSLSSKINLNGFEHKKAAICNRLRTRSKEKHSERIKRFLKDTGYILMVNNRIVIE